MLFVALNVKECYRWKSLNQLLDWNAPDSWVDSALSTAQSDPVYKINRELIFLSTGCAFLTLGKNSFRARTRGTFSVWLTAKADMSLLCCSLPPEPALTMPHSKQLLFAANFPLCCMHFIWRLGSCAIQCKPALLRQPETHDFLLPSPFGSK